LALLHTGGKTPSLRHLVKRCLVPSPMCFMAKAQILPGTLLGPGAVIFSHILLTAPLSSSSETSRSSLHSPSLWGCSTHGDSSPASSGKRTPSMRARTGAPKSPCAVAPTFAVSRGLFGTGAPTDFPLM